MNNKNRFVSVFFFLRWIEVSRKFLDVKFLPELYNNNNGSAKNRIAKNERRSRNNYSYMVGINMYMYKLYTQQQQLVNVAISLGD